MRKFKNTIRYASRKAYTETMLCIKVRFAKRFDVEIEVDQMFSTAIVIDGTGYGCTRFLNVQVCGGVFNMYYIKTSTFHYFYLRMLSLRLVWRMEEHKVCHVIGAIRY
ncbi:Zinc finger protein HD1 [Acorus gramineus]|uniref:Zinc finger protein HD1 n=1 Tax=Acorus gramineus TaxID=55184 RepID=A0AAV9BAC7_ACOGR|nr:Zinc finger protein HD1 [Acorus gramineus]